MKAVRRSGGQAVSASVAAVFLLTAFPPDRLYATAQCPDGAPPPCRGLAPRGVAGPAQASVAVLVFESRDTADAYLAEGLTEEIATSLSRVARLQVKSPSAVRRAQQQAPGDLRALGRMLNVFWVWKARCAGAAISCASRSAW